MKKVITGLLVLLCISALTGCGKDDVTLTNEDNDLVAEYIAGTLLKYSYDNEWKYQKLNSAQNGGGTTSSSGIQDIIIQYRLLRRQVIQRTHQQIY